MKVCVLTLGCKVNQYESEALAQMLKLKGFDITFEFSSCDAYIINTCSVTNMSDRKSRQLIHKCTKQESNPIVIVMGCYSQAKPNEVSQIEGVSVVVGTDNKTKIIDILEKEIKKREKIVCVSNEDCYNSFDFPPLVSYMEKTRAIIKIQDGCNSFCSYCIIPYVRGRLRSRNIENILNEINNIAQNGYKEIVLAGIHVCKYGVDFENPVNLTYLLKKIEMIDKIERIRLSSIEPLAFTDEFLEYFKNSKKLCPHFHISLQSGDNNVIKRMNRTYTREYYLQTLNKLRSINENVSITTDVIVGFPGETQEEFMQTVDMVKEAQFLKVHTFKYSKRSGTVAAQMKEQIPSDVMDMRSKIILSYSDEIQNKIISSYIGKILNVLFEEKKGDIYFGTSDNYITVGVKSNECLKGQIRNVVIKSVSKLVAYGEIEDTEHQENNGEVYNGL